MAACYKCPDRYPGCSGQCQKADYLQDRMALRQKHEAQAKQREADRIASEIADRCVQTHAGKGNRHGIVHYRKAGR